MRGAVIGIYKGCPYECLQVIQEKQTLLVLPNKLADLTTVIQNSQPISTLKELLEMLPVLSATRATMEGELIIPSDKVVYLKDNPAFAEIVNKLQ